MTRKGTKMIYIIGTDIDQGYETCCVLNCLTRRVVYAGSAARMPRPLWWWLRVLGWLHLAVASVEV